MLMPEIIMLMQVPRGAMSPNCTTHKGVLKNNPTAQKITNGSASPAWSRDVFEFLKEEWSSSETSQNFLSGKTISLISEYAKNSQGVKGFIFKLWNAISRIFGKSSDASRLNEAINVYNKKFLTKDFLTKDNIASFSYSQAVEKHPEIFLEYRSEDKKQLKRLEKEQSCLMARQRRLSEQDSSMLGLDDDKNRILELKTEINTLSNSLSSTAYCNKDNGTAGVLEREFLEAKNARLDAMLNLRRRISGVAQLYRP